jgi:polysaccharide pyruvyl transferase CsaB
MAPIVKRIVISGYYGFQNSGDEAVLQSILSSLQKASEQELIRIEPIVLSANPEETSKLYGVAAESRTNIIKLIRLIRKSDGLISGGGSLLQDVTSLLTIPYYLGIIKIAQWLKKPTFIYAQGVGPVQKKGFFAPIRSVFNKTVYKSVRDSQSKQFLNQIGVQDPIQIVPDPVMGMVATTEETVKQNEDKKNIGVSVRFWGKESEFLDRLAGALNTILKDEGVRVTFLPFHTPADEQASLYVIDRLEESLKTRVQIKSYLEPSQMLAAVGKCDVLIGMRLHALIYAANQSVPLVGISYDPKIDQFLQRLQMSAAASTDTFEEEKMVAAVQQMLSNPKQWQNQKQSLIEALKQEAFQPAQAIVNYYLQKG